MPVRRLNPEQVEELRQGDIELMRDKIIRRRDDNGNVLTITTIEQLAAWKGIKPARYHELKRTGWKLKRGVPAAEPVETVPADVFNRHYEMTRESAVKDGIHIKELETENLQLKVRASQLEDQVAELEDRVRELLKLVVTQ
jgi:hypothetical protein